MNYTYEMFAEGIGHLAHSIVSSGEQYNYIVGIGRGGLIPATALSYRLTTPLIPAMLQTRSGTTMDLSALANLPLSECLIVDDIIDSGATIDKLIDICACSDVNVACLIYNEGQQAFKPKFYHIKIDKRIDHSWVNFWWD